MHWSDKIRSVKSEIATEERIWAALAHLSVLAFGMGIVLPVVMWAEQRRKSNFAAFHSLQALGYQALGFTVWILASLLVGFVLIVVLLIVLGVSGQNGSLMFAATVFWMRFVAPLVALVALLERMLLLMFTVAAEAVVVIPVNAPEVAVV